MIDDLTFCVQTARSRAWITAFLMDTGQTLFAFGADNTFWSTAWRGTNVTRLTRASWTIGNYATHTVRAAWRWFARILWNIVCEIEMKNLVLFLEDEVNARGSASVLTMHWF